jgi:hypothetical protein
MSFAEQLEVGHRYEKAVATWLLRRGWRLLATYDFTGSNGDKAPRLLALNPSQGLIVPDLLGAKDGKSLWFEVKFKTAATFTRMTQRMETGIARRLFVHYSDVSRQTGIPVWLIFCHQEQDEVVSAELNALATVAREQLRGPMGPMVFFPCSAFKRLAALSDVAHAA